MNGLEIAGVGKSFGGVQALDQVDLVIDEGELFFLLGPSGCGKTTLLRVIAGFCVPDRGTVRFRGKDLLGKPIERRNIGMVFQNYSLWPHMSVFENVAYGLRIRRVSHAEVAQRVFAALTMVDMDGLGDRRPAELSGGQQQRVALARALVYEPEILLLDEPLSNLDAKLRKDMRREIRGLHQRLGITMVYVTHDQEEAATMADRIALMRDGRIVQVGSPETLYRRPESVYAAEFFGRANALPARVVSADDGAVVLDTGEQQLTARLSDGETAPPKGASVTAVVRPEDVAFRGSEDGTNTLAVTVREHEFNGSVESYTVESEGGTLLTLLALHRPDARLEPGARTRVRIAPHAIHLIAQGEAQ